MAKRVNPRQRGREKITDELVTKLVEFVRSGAYYSHAAGALGITRRTLSNWKNRGEADREAGRETLYAKLVVELETADDEAVVEAEKRVFIAGKRDYRAALAFLAKRRPEVWGDRIMVEAKLELDAVVSAMSDAELELMERMFEKAQARVEGSVSKH